MPVYSTDKKVYDIKCKIVGVNLNEERTQIKFKCETPEGLHLFPAVWIKNQAGGLNQEGLDELKSATGWDGRSLSGIKQRVGESVSVNAIPKKVGDKTYVNFFFNIPKEGGEKKSGDWALADHEFALLSGFGGTVASPKTEPTAPDLQINEENIPFSPAIY